MFCHCVVFAILVLKGQGRQAMSSNHSNSIKQFHTSCGNFSNMFDAELVVLASVNYFI
jgi:hypothetical protein